MTHYAQIFTINRQQLTVNLGYYEKERGKKQKIEVDVRLFFPSAPECAKTDTAPFIDYGILVQAMKDFIDGREFALVEHLATELFFLTRGIISAHCGDELKLWLKLTKLTTPIPDLAGGASYITSDLPADATFPPL
jgi:FolB domain-containing protein